MKRIYRSFFLSALAASISGCALSPTYVNDGEVSENQLDEVSLNPVHYKIEQGFKQSPPKCVAVLPLKNAMEKETTGENDKKYTLIELTDESLEQLRWSLYSQLAPFAYRDVELATVNKAIEQLGNETDYAALGKMLKCDAFLISEVTEYESGFFGIYSQTSIGINMKLIRARNQDVLWTGTHIATNRGGSVPFTPIGVIMGLYSAAENLSDEQLVRVKDDVFRRLLSTWSNADDSQNDSADNIQLAVEEYPFNISVKNLYLRSGPGTKFKPAAVLDQQDRIAIVDDKLSPWVQVKVKNGPAGYVNDKYLSVDDQSHKMAALDK